MNLLSVQTKVSWQERARLLEFVYESNVTDPGAVNRQVSSTSSRIM